MVNDLIGTSTEILQTFWHKDMSLLSHYLDDDVFYCGADPSQYYSSKNELVNYFYSVMNGCSESELTHMIYNVFLISGTYVLLLDAFFL